MEEIKDNEVGTDVSVENEESSSYEVEAASGPSKGFVFGVVSVLTGLVVGAGVLIHKHKKKKAEKEVLKEELDDEYFEEDYLTDEEFDGIDVVEDSEKEEKSGKK